MNSFSGVKIALIKDTEVLVIQRGDKPGLRYAGLWDFAGGGREGNETPFECVTREVREELGLTLAPHAIVWSEVYPAMHDSTQTAYFMVADIDGSDIKNIVFGNEGQSWKLMDIDDFMKSVDVVEPLKGRLGNYLLARSID